MSDTTTRTTTTTTQTTTTKRLHLKFAAQSNVDADGPQTIEVADICSGEYTGMHTGFVYVLAMTATDRQATVLLSGSGDGTLQKGVISSHEQAPLYAKDATLAHEGALFALAISGDKTFYTGGQNGSLKEFDTDTLCSRRSFTGHTSSIMALASMRDLLVSGDCTGTLKIWNTSTSYCLQTCQAHSGEISSIRSTASAFFTCGEDKVVKVCVGRTDTYVIDLLTHHHHTLDVDLPTRSEESAISIACVSITGNCI
jgi:WD40 repeat protein